MTQANTSSINSEPTFSVVPLTNTQLAALYGVGLKTFNKWLAPFRESIGKKEGRFYTVVQVKIIVQRLGIPGEIITG